MDFAPEQEEKFKQLAFGASEPLTIEVFSGKDEAVSYVNWCLSGSYGDLGIEFWWGRRRTQLNDRTPTEAWEDSAEQVIGLAGWLVNRSLEQS